MKHIFEEQLTIAFQELIVRGRNNPELEPTRSRVTTNAWYDKKTGGLVVQHSCAFEREWAPEDRKIAEIQPTRALALRRVIRLADAWRDEVMTAVPTTPQMIEAYDW